MGNSEVPEIKLRDDGSVVLTVKIYGFEPDTRVEISGQAIQPNGAIATFYDIQNLPGADSDGGYTLTVAATPLQKFEAGEEAITAVSRATKIWGTMLHRDSGNPPPRGIEAVWKAVQTEEIAIP